MPPQADGDDWAKEERDLAVEFEDDAADLMAQWPEYEGELPMISEEQLNKIAESAGMCATTISFPGGDVRKAKPTRRDLIVSAEEWRRVLLMALDEMRADLADSLAGFDQNGATEGPITFPAHLEAMASAAGHLMRICEEAAK